MEGKGRRVSILGPVLLIAIGVILLLNTQGVLEWSIWWDLLRLWPVLLIAAGLDLLIGRRSIWGSLLATALVLAVLGGALWLTLSDATPSGLSSQQIQQPLSGATQAQIAIKPAAATLRLEALPESAHLIEGVVYLDKGEEIVQDLSRQGSQATYTLASEDGTAWVPFFGWGEQRLWDLGLSPGVPLTLEANLGAGEGELDLTGLALSDLTVGMGVGRVEITLPAEGRFRANIDQAIGELVVIIPEDLAVRLHADTGLAGRNLPGDFVSAGDDVYTSPGYATADNRVELEASIAIGVLTVRYTE